MQVMIEIPDEVVAAIRERGLSPKGYVEGLVAERRIATAPQLDIEERKALLKRFIEGISRNSEKTPLLPDEAFTRESMYSDHD